MFELRKKVIDLKYDYKYKGYFSPVNSLSLDTLLREQKGYFTLPNCRFKCMLFNLWFINLGCSAYLVAALMNDKKGELVES